MKSVLGKILRYGSIFWIINFWLCAILSFYIGGMAISGYVSNGSYFVGLGGEYTKVSKLVWYVNYVQGIICFVPIPIIRGIVSMIKNKN